MFSSYERLQAHYVRVWIYLQHIQYRIVFGLTFSADFDAIFNNENTASRPTPENNTQANFAYQFSGIYLIFIKSILVQLSFNTAHHISSTPIITVVRLMKPTVVGLIRLTTVMMSNFKPVPFYVMLAELKRETL